MRLPVSIAIPPGWGEVDNPGGPPTFVRNKRIGVLQFSSPPPPIPELPSLSHEALLGGLRRYGQLNGVGALVSEQTGTCALGSWALAIFYPDAGSLMHAWLLSDGEILVLATYMGSRDTSVETLTEAHEAVMQVTKRPTRKESWWRRFWSAPPSN